MYSAKRALPFNLFDKEINIIDWFVPITDETEYVYVRSVVYKKYIGNIVKQVTFYYASDDDNNFSHKWKFNDEVEYVLNGMMYKDGWLRGACFEPPEKLCLDWTYFVYGEGNGLDITIKKYPITVNTVR